MHYLLFDINNQKILNISSSELPPSEINPKELFPSFTAGKMQVVWTSMGRIPSHFRIGPNGKLISSEGAITDQLDSDSLKKQGIIKTDFNPPSDTKKSPKPSSMPMDLSTIVNEDLVNSAEDLKVFDNRLQSGIHRRVTQAYPLRVELRIYRNYLIWLAEGKPKNDPREERFLNMHDSLEEIDADYEQLWAYSMHKKNILNKETLAIPRESSSKTDIQAYLDQVGIPYTKSESKAQLLAKISDKPAS
ncbi:MAG: hypothetical protein AAF388_00095 [Bacteroidota bacterium]